MKEYIDREHQTIVRDEDIPLPVPIPPHIRGWLWAMEVEWLYARAMEVGPPFLEVGSYRGLSSAALAQAGPLVCVDTWVGGEDLPNEDGYMEHCHNLDRLKLFPTRIRANSEDVLPSMVGQYGLVFIDGSHKFSTVRSDLKHGWRLLRRGGLLVADDYLGFAGVFRAVDLMGGFQLVGGKSKMAFRYKE